MRILHLIGQKPGETGSGIYLKNIIKVGKSKGYTQCVIAGIDINDQEYLKSMPAGVLFYPVCFNTQELPFAVPGMSDVMPYASTKYSEMTAEMFLLWQKAFTKVLKKGLLFKPDFIVVHHLWLLASLSREIFPKTPMIGICHSTELRQLVSATQFKDYVLKGCSQLDGVAALSSFQKSTIEKVYGIAEERIKVIGGGFANEVFFPPPKKLSQEKIKLLYAGKLSFAKGIPSLLGAFSKLPISKDKIELILAGSGSGPEYGEIMATLKAGPGNVKFMGLISQREMASLMRDAHIFVLPSFYEGFSLAAVEALASGLRLVVNDLPAMREWIGTNLTEAGLVEFVKMPKLNNTDIPEPTELLKYEARLITGMVTQIKATESCAAVPLLGWQEMVHKYSWQVVFTKIEDIYTRLPNHKNF